MFVKSPHLSLILKDRGLLMESSAVLKRLIYLYPRAAQPYQKLGTIFKVQGQLLEKNDLLMVTYLFYQGMSP